jgi:hypothetical protein
MCILKHPGALARSASIHTNLRAISYVCSFWVAHLVQHLDDNSTDGVSYQEYFSDQGRVHKFLLKHLLHWFEALSLIGEIDKGIMGLHSLEEKLTKLPSENILRHKKFVQDAIRVFRQCRAAVEEVPLQVYCSALIFSPEESLVRQTFKQEILQWISPLPRISNNWNPCLQTLEGTETGSIQWRSLPTGSSWPRALATTRAALGRHHWEVRADARGRRHILQVDRLSSLLHGYS